jgi:hypothetical protein
MSKALGAQTDDTEGLARWATNNQVNSAKLPEETLTNHLTDVSFDKNILVQTWPVNPKTVYCITVRIYSQYQFHPCALQSETHSARATEKVQELYRLGAVGDYGIWPHIPLACRTPVPDRTT